MTRKEIIEIVDQVAFHFSRINNRRARGLVVENSACDVYFALMSVTDVTGLDLVKGVIDYNYNTYESYVSCVDHKMYVVYCSWCTTSDLLIDMSTYEDYKKYKAKMETYGYKVIETVNEKR